MGPWQHQYGNVSPAGPRNDIWHEMLRWWDRYLKGSPLCVCLRLFLSACLPACVPCSLFCLSACLLSSLAP